MTPFWWSQSCKFCTRRYRELADVPKPKCQCAPSRDPTSTTPQIQTNISMQHTPIATKRLNPTHVPPPSPLQPLSQGCEHDLLSPRFGFVVQPSKTKKHEHPWHEKAIFQPPPPVRPKRRTLSSTPPKKKTPKKCGPNHPPQNPLAPASSPRVSCRLRSIFSPRRQSLAASQALSAAPQATRLPASKRDRAHGHKLPRLAAWSPNGEQGCGK